MSYCPFDERSYTNFSPLRVGGYLDSKIKERKVFILKFTASSVLEGLNSWYICYDTTKGHKKKGRSSVDT